MKTNALCAVDNEIKRLQGELAKLREKTHQRRSKVLRKRNDGGNLSRVRALDVVCIDGRDHIEVSLT